MIKCLCFGVKSWELGERTNLIYLVRLCLFSHSECFWPQASDLTSEPPFLHRLKEDNICNTSQRCEAEVRPRRKPSTECSLHHTPLLLAAAVVSLVTIYAVPTRCTRNFTPAVTTFRWLSTFHRRGDLGSEHLVLRCLPGSVPLGLPAELWNVM